MSKKLKAKKFYTPHESHLQNGIYLLVFVILALLCWPLAPKPNDNSVGILLPQGTTYPAISPNDVQVVNTQPKGAELVGQINTKIYYSAISKESDDSNLQKNLNLARQLAAEQGANIIVINSIGRTMDLGPLNGFVVYGVAYHD